MPALARLLAVGLRLSWGRGLVLAAVSAGCAVAPGGGAATFGGTDGESAPSTTADPGSTGSGSTSADETAAGPGGSPTSDDSSEGGSVSTGGGGSESTGAGGSVSTSDGDSTGPVIPPDDSSGGFETNDTTGGVGTTSDGGETGAPKGFPDAGGTCTSGTFDEHFPDELGDPELVILGVYQPTNTDIDVAIDRAGPSIIVVLSSYEPVHWVLDIAAGTDVQEVILNGYEQQTVEGEGTATVTDRSGIGNYLEACAYAYPGDDGGCETEQLIAGAEALTGTTLALFAGCYEASSFSLN